MNAEDMGIAREEKKGRLHYFQEYRVIKRGLNTGCIEFVTGKALARKMKAPPESVLRWPKGREPTKKELKLMEEVKATNMALKNVRKRKEE